MPHLLAKQTNFATNETKGLGGTMSAVDTSNSPATDKESFIGNDVAAGTDQMMTYPGIPGEAGFQLSPGEIHYLYWYIQGAIMEPETRQELRKAWGFCERHAWAAMIVESAFRHSYFHGPSIVYEDIMGRAVTAFEFSGPLQNLRLKTRLREKGSCIMCEMGYGPRTEGHVRMEIIETGGNPGHLRSFALKTEKYWARTVCGRCAANESAIRCRRHLIEDLTEESCDDRISGHRELLRNLYGHLTVYARSFRLEYHGIATEEDMAALISAVGWCSGWKPLFQIIGKSQHG